MNIKLFFKKLFGLPPTVGDRVHGHICYGSTFSGTIVKDNSKSIFSHYVINGSTVYYKEWTWERVEEYDEKMIIPTHLCRYL